MNRTSAVLWFLWLIQVTHPAPTPCQTVHGMVVDSLTAGPLADAWVTYGGDRGSVTTSTGTDGRFEILLEGEPPFTLLVQRTGYAERSLRVGREGLAEDLRVLMVAVPFDLPELAVEGKRQGPDLRFLRAIATDTGLVNPGLSYCTFVMIDSVVVKDYDLLRPEVYRHYDRARLWTDPDHDYTLARVFLQRKYISDPRLLHDAWPCGVIWIEKHRRMDLLRRLPKPPIPEGKPVALVSQATLSPPPLSPCPGALAVSRGGEVALVGQREAQVRLLGPGGEGRPSLGPDLPGGAEPCALRVGWRSDTLWVADASRTRVTLYPPTGPPVVREPIGLPKSRHWNTSERTLSSSPLETDLPVPLPAAGNRWLWTYPAPDPPSPPIHPDDAPGRLLVVLDDQWKLKLVLAALRPGAAGVDVVLGSAPVLGDQPFGDHPLVGLSPDGRHVTIVRREHQMAAWMTAYRVTRVGLDGDTLFNTERRAPMVRVSDKIFDAAVADLAERPGAVEALGGTSELRRALVGSLVYRPPFQPPISDLLVGQDGKSWLRWPDDGEERVRWEVLDGGGRPLWTFEADRALKLIAADADRVWGLKPEEGGGVRLVRFLVVSQGGG